MPLWMSVLRRVIALIFVGIVCDLRTMSMQIEKQCKCNGKKGAVIA